MQGNLYPTNLNDILVVLESLIPVYCFIYLFMYFLVSTSV